MRKFLIPIFLGLIVLSATLWSVIAGASSSPPVNVTAKKTGGDPANPGDPFWDSVAGQNLRTSANPLLGGHGAAGNKPEINIKSAFNNDNLYMYLEWSDPTNSNLYGWWTFDSANATWTPTGEEVEQDRLYVMWPITDAAGREGKTFAEAGCKAFCHRVTSSGDTTDTPGTIGECGTCHQNTAGAKPEDFEHQWVVPGSDCDSCHADRGLIGGVKADMAAPAGGALDIWHWKAQDSYVGFATDQAATSGKKRGNDGSPSLDPDNKNTPGNAPKYIWPLNADNSASNGDFNNFLLKSMIGTPQVRELAGDGLTLKDTTVPVPDGTTVRKKILNDVDATSTIKNIMARQSYSGGTYRVVLKRALDSPDIKDYDFKLDAKNYFSVAVTDNSEIKHAGSNGPHTLLLDTKSPPAAGVKSPAYSTKVSKTTKFKVSWSGSDPSPSSGIAGYDVQFKIAGSGAWTDWKTNTPGTSADFKAKAGRTYYFRARMIDKAGNIGAWSNESKTIVPYDNNGLIVNRTGFGGTYKSSTSKFYLGTVRYSKTKGDAIVYKFKGKGVSLVSTKAKNRSRAKIYIDGKLVKKVDAYSAKTRYRRLLYTKVWDKEGTHKIKIVNLATAGRKRFDIDGLGVVR